MTEPAGSLNLQNFLVFILRNYGPFSCTPEELADAMNDAGHGYQIAITPEPDGSLSISIEEEQDVDE